MEALEKSKEVFLSFIFDPEQTKNNSYKSLKALRFMCESLENLKKDLEHKLAFFEGSPEKIVEELILKEKIEAVFVNRDYTPFSIQRDKKIKHTCYKMNISFHSIDDNLLTKPEEVFKKDGTPYSVFTFFHKKAMEVPLSPVMKNRRTNYSSMKNPPGLLKKYSPPADPRAASSGGRMEGLRELKKISLLGAYMTERDFPFLNKTSHLSAHLKFGTISIREVYKALASSFGESYGLIRQLYWRDFFSHIAFHFPHVFKGAFKPQFDHLSWSGKEQWFLRWKEGTTGFPIVDAGMRELNQTGYMHNRVRMITASFLVKDLHINWREGERYFASKLIDYDPALNNGNWQWCASTGCDAQPWFRIFNPWLQQKKFDPECEYIKGWIPELRDLAPRDIHNLFKGSMTTKYPSPIIDHKKETALTKQFYSACISKPG